MPQIYFCLVVATLITVFVLTVLHDETISLFYLAVDLVTLAFHRKSRV